MYQKVKVDKRIKNNKKGPGRPIKPIDWNRVDELLLAGCTGTEIAPYFDMNVDTFYDKFYKEKNTQFTVYSLEKRSQGNSILREKQYLKALGLSESGDNTLLIWLGKNRLLQREIPAEVTIDETTFKSFSALMQQLMELQNSQTDQQEESSEAQEEIEEEFEDQVT